MERTKYTPKRLLSLLLALIMLLGMLPTAVFAADDPVVPETGTSWSFDAKSGAVSSSKVSNIYKQQVLREYQSDKLMTDVMVAEGYAPGTEHNVGDTINVPIMFTWYASGNFAMSNSNCLPDDFYVTYQIKNQFGIEVYSKTIKAEEMKSATPMLGEWGATIPLIIDNDGTAKFTVGLKYWGVIAENGVTTTDWG